jgi:hypothetical protein
MSINLNQDTSIKISIMGLTLLEFKICSENICLCLD